MQGDFIIQIHYEKPRGSRGYYRVKYTGHLRDTACIPKAESLEILIKKANPSALQISQEAIEQLGEEKVEQLRRLVE
jgi:hypothetical protein